MSSNDYQDELEQEIRTLKQCLARERTLSTSLTRQNEVLRDSVRRAYRSAVAAWPRRETAQATTEDSSNG